MATVNVSNFPSSKFDIEWNITNGTSDSMSSSESDPDYASLLLLIVVVFTLIGNCLVVLAVVLFKELRTVTNHMILSLAISDLLIALLVMPFNISNKVLDNYWPYGRVMCHIWHSFDVLASTASILNLCIISLDRYWAVTNPIAYPRRMSKRRGFICLTLVWLCSAGISFPMIHWWNSVDEVTPGRCYFTDDTSYLVISSMISFYIPVLVMVIVYAKIFLVIRAQSKKYSSTSVNSERKHSGMILRAHRGGEINKNVSELSPMLPSDTGFSSPPSNNNDNNKENCNSEPIYALEMTEAVTGGDTFHLKRLVSQAYSSSLKKTNNGSNEFRVARTLGVVLGVFLIFWLPFFVCNFLTAVCKDCHISDSIFEFVTWLGHVNSGVNPVIYALSMENMREAFISILCCRCKRNRQQLRRKKITFNGRAFATD